MTGRNGAGKSTLLRKLITSLNVPQEHITYVPQEIGLEHSQDILTQVRALPDKQKGYMMTIVSGSGERHPCHQEETTTVWRK